EPRVASAPAAPPSRDRTTRTREGGSEIPRQLPAAVGTTWNRLSHRARASAIAPATATSRARSAPVRAEGGAGGASGTSARRWRVAMPRGAGKYRKGARTLSSKRRPSMPSILKLPDLWRVMRELDLESIRRDAEGRFRILVLAASRAEAEAAAVLLSGEETPHPWLEVATPEDLSPAGADLATLTAALLISDGAGLTPEV